MLRFKQYIRESADKKSGSNSALGDAYETATVLHIHNNTAAKDNTDKAYNAHINSVKAKHEEAMAKLPEETRKKVLEGAKNSANAYLGSLRTNHGMAPENIHEVHHTNFGIDAHVGRTVDRPSNPHDLIVKGQKGGKQFLHGASLKLTSGTASNNSVKAFDEKAGLNTDLSKIWNAGKQRAGLAGLSGKEIKKRRDEPEVKTANAETQKEAANHHAETFNSADHATKVAHLRYLIKSKPDLDYDYVKGEKGGSSKPISEVPQNKALEKATKITATVKNNIVHFHDQDGNHIAYAEHRPTHGAFNSIQVNAKYGNMK